MSDLASQVERNIRGRGLLEDGRSIVVAVSGGLDSMVLLRVLHQLAPGHHWQLTLAHLNHRLRGRSSQADARLVRRAAAGLGLPLVTEEADVRAVALASGLSLEMAARKVRHDFLARAALDLGAAAVALAHHADDQVELFFLRLLRGSSGEGLAGMKWRSPSPSDPRVMLVRPLLDQPKAALRAWAAAQEVPFRQDASNDLLVIPRNRIRHQLLPLLRRRYQPALERTVLRAMDIIGEEARFAAEAAQQWLQKVGWKAQTAVATLHEPEPKPPGFGLRQSSAAFTSPAPRKRQRTGAVQNAARPGTPVRSMGPRRVRPSDLERFQDLPVAVQRRCLQWQLLAQGVTADFELVERLRARPGCPVSVGGQLCVVRDAAGLVRLEQSGRAAFLAGRLEVELGGRAGEVMFEKARLSWRIRRATAVGGPKRRRAGEEYFDADRVGTPVVVRHWQPGDRFQPIGMAAPMKLQDFFTNEKILRNRRHELMVGVTAQGEVFWVEELRISERFKLTRFTKRRLQWRWRPL